MIVSEDGTAVSLVTQADHALLAYRLLTLWRLNGLPEHSRRDELLFAVREHDNGWQRADAAPRMSEETGLPTSFDRMPAAERLTIWRRSTRRHLQDHRHASFLIIRHAQEVNQDYSEQEGWPDFFDELAELALELSEQSPATEEELEADYAWLELADLLSLGGCGAFSGSEPMSGELSGYHFLLETGRIALDPFPLAGPTTLEVPCRSLPGRPFEDPAKMAGELLSAVWRRRIVRIEPLNA